MIFFTAFLVSLKIPEFIPKNNSPKKLNAYRSIKKTLNSSIISGIFYQRTYFLPQHSMRKLKEKYKVNHFEYTM